MIDFAVIRNHQTKLFTIIDASIPNKTQNNAVKEQIVAVVKDLMDLAAGQCEPSTTIKVPRAVVVP